PYLQICKRQVPLCAYAEREPDRYSVAAGGRRWAHCPQLTVRSRSDPNPRRSPGGGFYVAPGHGTLVILFARNGGNRGRQAWEKGEQPCKTAPKQHRPVRRACAVYCVSRCCSSWRWVR